MGAEQGWRRTAAAEFEQQGSGPLRHRSEVLLLQSSPSQRSSERAAARNAKRGLWLLQLRALPCTRPLGQHLGASCKPAEAVAARLQGGTEQRCSETTGRASQFDNADGRT